MISNQSTIPQPSAGAIQVILVGVQRQLDSRAGFAASMNELGALAASLGWQVSGRITQRMENLCFATAIGRGKLNELKALVSTLQTPVSDGSDDIWVDSLHQSSLEAIDPAEREGDPSDAPSDDRADEPRRSRRAAMPGPQILVLFNEPLSPIQFRSMEAHLGIEVLDRTGVILEIFRQRARTRESKLQVELARLQYMALRMRERRGKKMDQQAAGIGAKGLGEAAHKIEKRWLRDRTAQLRRELASISHKRKLRCARRSGAFNVSLVGYTNAGKSSWMRALAGGEVWIKDCPFATLETTVRLLSTSAPQDILLSDTVGFIEDLPHELVASFRSTLEEARQADLLLHIVDASATLVERQIRVTEETLHMLEADRIPRLLIFNKVDLLTPDQRETLALLFPEALFFSAHDTEDVAQLMDTITGYVAGSVVEEELFVPYHQHHLLANIYKTMDVLELTHEDEGSQLLVRAFSAAYQLVVDQLSSLSQPAEPAVA